MCVATQRIRITITLITVIRLIFGDCIKTNGSVWLTSGIQCVKMVKIEASRRKICGRAKIPSLLGRVKKNLGVFPFFSSLLFATEKMWKFLSTQKILMENFYDHIWIYLVCFYITSKWESNWAATWCIKGVKKLVKNCKFSASFGEIWKKDEIWFSRHNGLSRLRKIRNIKFCYSIFIDLKLLALKQQITNYIV